MNGPCCPSRLALLKWPALLTLALMFAQPVDRPLLAATLSNPSDATMRTISSGPVELSVTVDRTEVRVADPFTLRLTATAPQGVRVQFPDMGDRLGDFLITKSDDAFDVPDGANRTWTRTLRLESLTSGNHEVPPITLTYTDARAKGTAGNAGTIATPALPITIASEVEANADPTRFRDIKGVVELVEPPQRSYAWAVWTAAGLGVLALAGVWLLAVRKRSLTADQWALRELDQIEQSGLIEAGEFDTFFVRVTDVLRAYIERRFAIRAPQLSTPEFLALAETHAAFDDDRRGLLKAFLKLSDFVKFARFAVTVGDAERALKHARRFIEQSSDEVAKPSTKDVSSTEASSLAVSA